MKKRFLFFTLFSLLLAAAIFLFLWLGIPQYLLYQEQYQLFLFTDDYFSERLSSPGGMADYIGEFITQFYYVPLYGAILTALLLTSAQVLLGLACRRCALRDIAYFMAAVPSILYVGAMGDENVLLSYAAAMMLTSLFLYLDTFRRKTAPLFDSLIIIAGFTMLYWMAGPFAFVYIIGYGILRRSPISSVVGFAFAFFLIWMMHELWFEQIPVSRMLQGINYYRVPEIYPCILYVIAVISALIPVVTLIKAKGKNMIIVAGVVSTAALLAAVCFVPKSFNPDKSRVFAYDALVRQGRWSDIIEKAKKERPSDQMSLQAQNLALGMRGQLAESMFQFNQKGIEGLIGRDHLDNTSQLITAEVLYRLGLTKVAFSTTFDLQEAIMNDRKSGRFMKRMAECMLINGNYPLAEKFLKQLEHSLYYSDWAKNAEKLLGDESAIDNHPVYGPLRRNAFQKEVFYSQPEIEKILAMSAADSKGSNLLAWQYFCAACMLKGELPMLAGMYVSTADMFGSSVPRNVQEAIALFWTMGHQSFDGIPIPISPEVQQQTIALAQTAMRYPDNPTMWQQTAPGSYGVYFLNLQRANKTQTNSLPNYQPTHE